MEYCMQFTSPYFSKGILALEAVQRRFIKFITRKKALSHEESLSRIANALCMTMRHGLNEN